MIELNGIQISDNNINTKKNVKIYVDEKQLDTKVGELSDLETTNKSSIVNAINEVKNTTDTIQVDVNRIYSDFTIIPNTPTEQEFTYKKSDEGVIEKGVAVIDKVKGNSVVWNQRIKNATFINTSEWDATYSTFSVSGGIASVTASADGDNYTQQLVPMVVGHKYLYIFMAATDTANKNLPCAYIFYGDASNNKIIKAKDDTNWHTYNAIVTCVSNTRNIVRLEVTKVGTSQFKNVSLIDLTQMFGAGNEPTTYEEFLSRKPKVADEYAYNEGTIVSNKIEAVETIGINLFNNKFEVGSFDVISGQNNVNPKAIRTKEYVPIIPNTKMYAGVFGGTPQSLWIMFFDENKNVIEGYTAATPQSGNCSDYLNRIFTTPSNGYFMRFYVKHDIENICINLSDPAINGKYFPYEEHSIDLSWVKEIKDTEGVKLFEDGMKSAGTAFDEVGKNKAVKRLGVKVFDGTEDWASSNRMYYLDDYTLPNSPKVVNSICNTYSFSSKTAGFKPGDDHTYGLQPKGAIVFNDSTYTSVTAWKSHLAELYAAGTPLVVYYELAEPIEVEYDEKNLTYPVIAGGTEEAIASEPSTPMRASITYGSNTVATILSLINRVNELERKIIN